MTTKQKIELCERMKEIINDNRFNRGFCWAYSTVMKDYSLFVVPPFLEKYKPKNVGEYYWFPFNVGRQKRIAILNKAIKELKAKLK